MAIKLTPFAKLLIGAIVLVGSGSVLWNLYKHRKTEGGDDTVAAAQGSASTSSAAAATGKGTGDIGSAPATR